MIGNPPATKARTQNAEGVRGLPKATTMLMIQRAARRTDQVNAAPFRAHLILLLEASRLTVPQLAAHVGLPTTLCQNLLVGRPGHPPLRRISPADAAALIRHTPASVAQAVQHRGSAYAARDLVHTMINSGWQLELLAEVGGIGLSTLTRLADGELTVCTTRLELSVRALSRWCEARVAPTPMRSTATARISSQQGNVGARAA